MKHLSRLVPPIVALIAILGSAVMSAHSSAHASPRPSIDRSLIAHARIDTDPQTGHARFFAVDRDASISPARTTRASDPVSAARAFLAEYGSLFGLRNVADLRPVRISRAADRTFTRFQQTFRGVPVLGGELVVQTLPDGATLSANGELVSDLAIDTTPRIAAATAQQIARGRLARATDREAIEITAAAPQLAIYAPALLGAPGPQLPALVWRTEVAAAPSRSIHELVLINAHTGAVALQLDLNSYARQRIVCDNANQIALHTPLCEPADAERVEGQAASGIADVDHAYEYSGATYNFLLDRFGRDSLDGAGLPLRAAVRACTPVDSCPTAISFWDGRQAVFGEHATTDDLVAHELTHGLIQYTAGLYPYYQSGAIGESLADVFGELIDQSYHGPDDTDTSAVMWLLGEDLPGGAIRNLRNPTNPPDVCGTPPCNPAQPDRMSSALYVGGEADSGGIHTNGGVNNKAAWLMAEGGSFNGETVDAIGNDKVAQIYYEVTAHLLVSGSDYRDLYNLLPQACRNLIDTHSIVSADCMSVQRAVDAVEMNQQPDAAPATKASVCGSGAPIDFLYDDLEQPARGLWAVTSLIGSPGWYYPPNSHNYIDFNARYATSGVNNLWGDNPGSRGDSAIGMTRDVLLPPGARLHFRHAFGFDDARVPTPMYYDGGVIEYSTDAGATWSDAGSLIASNGYRGTIDGDGDNPLAGRDAFVAQSNGYISSRVDLSSLAGQRFRLRFRIGTDSAFGDYGWFVDDIRVYVCGDPNQQQFLPSVMR